ncbi:hypothetical protein PG988_010520 [Apiospora saccharicola]
MRKQLRDQRYQEPLTAAIALGLEAIYEPAIAAAVPYAVGDPDSGTTHVGSHKVHLHDPNPNLGTPLYAAVKAQKPALVQRLISNFDSMSTDNLKLVAAAVQNDDMDMLNLLLEWQNRLSPNQPHAIRVIEVAASLNRPTIIQNVLDLHGLDGCSITDRDRAMRRALMRAVLNKDVEAARLLIDNGAPFATMDHSDLGWDPDRPDLGSYARDPDTTTLVEIAAWQGHLEMLQLLFSRIALVNMKSAEAAMAGNHVGALQTLLAAHPSRFLRHKWVDILLDAALLDSTAVMAYLIDGVRVLDIPEILSRCYHPHSRDTMEADHLGEVAGRLCSRGNYLGVEALIRAGLPADHGCPCDPGNEFIPGEDDPRSLMDLATNSLAPGAAETVRMLTRYGAAPAPKRGIQYDYRPFQSKMPLRLCIEVVKPQEWYTERQQIAHLARGGFQYSEDMNPLQPGGLQRVPMVR